MGEQMNEQQNGLICAWQLDGSGGGVRLDWHGVLAWQPAGAPLWVHLDYAVDASRDWLLNLDLISPLVADALLSDESRSLSDFG